MKIKSIFSILILPLMIWTSAVNAQSYSTSDGFGGFIHSDGTTSTSDGFGGFIHSK